MFSWTENMSVGVKQLDEEHKHLFQQVNTLLHRSENELGDDPVSDHQLLDNIMDYNLFHIKNEEELMEMFDCQNPRHIAMHHEYIANTKELFLAASSAVREQSKAARQACREFAMYAGKWHITHIMNMDKTYSECFHEHGLY